MLNLSCDWVGEETRSPKVYFAVVGLCWFLINCYMPWILKSKSMGIRVVFFELQNCVCVLVTYSNQGGDAVIFGYVASAHCRCKSCPHVFCILSFLLLLLLPLLLQLHGTGSSASQWVSSFWTFWDIWCYEKGSLWPVSSPSMSPKDPAAPETSYSDGELSVKLARNLPILLRWQAGVRPMPPQRIKNCCLQTIGLNHIVRHITWLFSGAPRSK